MLTFATLLTAGCIDARPDGTTDDRNGSLFADPTPDEACQQVTTTDPPGAGAGQSGVANYPGSFSYGGQSAAKTATETYVWQNPSGAAYVAWGGQVATGSVTLTMEDACGKEMYKGGVSGPSQGGANEETERGMAGDWTLTFEFTVYTGQMGLSVSSS